MDGEKRPKQLKEGSKKRRKTEGEEIPAKANKRAKTQSTAPPIIPSKATAVPLPTLNTVPLPTGSQLSIPKPPVLKQTSPVPLPGLHSQSISIPHIPKQSHVPVSQAQVGLSDEVETSKDGKKKVKEKRKKPREQKERGKAKPEDAAAQNQQLQQPEVNSGSKKKKKRKSDREGKLLDISKPAEVEKDGTPYTGKHTEKKRKRKSKPDSLEVNDFNLEKAEQGDVQAPENGDKFQQLQNDDIPEQEKQQLSSHNEESSRKSKKRRKEVSDDQPAADNIISTPQAIKESDPARETPISTESQRKPKKRRTDNLTSGLVTDASAPTIRPAQPFSSTILSTTYKRPARPSASASAALEGMLSTPTTPRNTGFSILSTLLYLPVPPIAAGYPFEGALCGSLTRSLFEYHPPVHGIICGHQNARIAPAPGEVELSMAQDSNGYAASHLWVAADLLVFRPCNGAWLAGLVSLQTESHLALVVKGLWNASVGRKRLPKSWQWVEEGDDESLHEDGEIDLGKLRLGGAGRWVDGNGTPVAGLLVFRAKSFDITTEKDKGRTIVSIEGTMLDEEQDAEADKYDELSAPRITRPRKVTSMARMSSTQVVPLKPQADTGASAAGPSAQKKTKSKKGKERA